MKPKYLMLSACVAWASFGDQALGASRDIGTKALSAMRSSINAIYAYDLHVEAKHLSLFDYRLEPGKGKPVVVLDGARVEPKVMSFVTRQIKWRDKLRFDDIEPNGVAIRTTHWVTPSEECYYQIASKDASMLGHRMEPAAGGHDYRIMYQFFSGHRTELLHTFENRTSLNTLQDQEFPSLVTLAVDPEPGSRTSEPSNGFLLRLDPNHGMLPAYVKSYKLDGGKMLVDYEQSITDWLKLPDGVWVPTRSVRKHYITDKSRERGRLQVEIQSRVIESKSKWNQPIDQSLLTVRLPAGTRIADMRLNAIYTLGEAAIGDDLKAISKKAINVMKVNPMSDDSAPDVPKPAPPTNWSLIVSLIIGTALLAVMARVVMIRLRGAK